MAFTLRQLQYFVAVAEQGTVSGASHVLSISQSAVTEAIKDLESDLGVSLFERHSRGLNITQQGHLFLRHATKILASVAEAKQFVGSELDEATGTLHLGVTSLVAGYVLSDILARYRRAFPGIEVVTTEDDGSYLEHLLVGGELDVAVLLLNNLRDKQALQFETLEMSQFSLWIPAGHSLTGKESIAMSDIAELELIMLTTDEIEEATRKLLAAFDAKPKVAFRTRSVEAVRSLVATGAGVALLPDMIYRPWSLEGDRIELRDVSASLPAVNVGIVWRKGLSVSQPLKDFIALAQTQRSPRLR